MNQKTPLIALVGLPNAGKSTLLNKLTGTKKAIVAREAHTTRDLNYADTEWENMYLRFVDTGGMVPDPEDKIQKEIQIRSASAIAQADILIWVIDRRQDPETISDAILRKIWKSGKPFIICINKVDNPNNDRNIGDYAKLGGSGFVNVSSFNGYGINILLDEIVELATSLGFEKTITQLPELPQKESRKRKVPKKVRKGEDGGYFILRENSEEGPGLFKMVEGETIKKVEIKNVVYDLFGVLVYSKDGTLALDDHVLQSMEKFRDEGKNLYYLSNLNSTEIELFQKNEWLDIFDGGLTSSQSQYAKPDGRFFGEFLMKYELIPEETVFIDDKEDNVKGSIEVGMWGMVYQTDVTDIEFEIELIESGEVSRIPPIPRLLLLGRPNVGKSTLFNTLFGENIQIVTDIPGTTLSVNDLALEHEGNTYIILDSAGIRKSGQRETGVESFATYRTIQAAYDADVILFIVDSTVPVTHQDQVVAGIIKESKKGVVVVANKADCTDSDQRKRFLKDFTFKFSFLKVARFVWFSAKKAGELQRDQKYFDKERYSFEDQIVDVERLWEEIEQALHQRNTEIDKEELRKLFNYLMKRKPPQKLRNKKRAVIYDLIYTKSSPPTFELLVKDKSTIHWSYTRFLENIIRRQFRFDATGVNVKIKEVDRKKIVG